MFISKVEIEGGFLNNLSVSFLSGLNAIIGIRGSGKTSLIELIRYCLDVESSNNVSENASRLHALSVLGDGNITVTLQKDGDEYMIQRSSGGKKSSLLHKINKPLIYSQTEVETIGVEPAGRLKMINDFLEKNIGRIEGLAEVLQSCKRKVASVDKLRNEVEILTNDVKSISAIKKELKQLEAKEEKNKAESVAIKQMSKKLDAQVDKLNIKSKECAEYEEVIEFADEQIDEYLGLADLAVELKDTFKGLKSSNAKKLVDDLFDLLSEGARWIKSINVRLDSSEDMLSELHNQKEKLKASTFKTRRKIEDLQEGSGEILKQVDDLRGKLSLLTDKKEKLHYRKNKLSNLIDERDSLFDELEEFWDLRFKSRFEIVEYLNKILGPEIKIEIIRRAETNNVIHKIAGVMKGSGLQYKDVSGALANGMSPRSLMEAVDSYNVDLMAEVGGVTKVRARKILSHLSTCDLSEIVTIDVEDKVDFYLLDGSKYKHIDDLSTGQRCTVVLPIILAHEGAVTIIDQPEDHIDNAFITNTLIKVLKDSTQSKQVICSTHNPNIPVLGDAQHVVHLGSNGKKGFVISAGSLSNNNIISDITTIMEGGKRAFEKRAEYYKKLTKTNTG